MMSDQEARTILVSVWENNAHEAPSLEELQAVQAIGRFEGLYGSGRAKNNWGSVQCGKGPPCPDNCIELTDSHANGEKYQWCYQVYATPEDGCGHLVRLLTVYRPTTLAALKTGDAYLIAKTMRDTKYFETSIANYQKAIYDNAKTIAKSLGETLMISMGDSGSRFWVIPGMVAVAWMLAKLLKRT